MTKTPRKRLNALRRARYRKNPQCFIAAVVKSHRKHAERFRAYLRAWRKKNRKRLAKQRLKNLERIRAYHRAYYHANAEKLKARTLAYNRGHAEQVAETKRKWYYAHLDRERTKGRERKRKARLKAKSLS
jgi:hypothetical protein